MKVRVNLAITMNPVLEHFQVFGEIFQKGAAIQGVAKGDVAGICPGNDVIQAVRQINTFRSSHKNSSLQ